MHVIQSRPFTYECGVAFDGRQVLLGWTLNTIAVLSFNEEGILVEVKAHPLIADISRGFGTAVEASVAEQISALKQALGFHERPIKVKPFELPDLDVALKELPEDMEEFLAAPELTAPADQPYFIRDIRAWKEQGNCVLHWGNDYYLDAAGETI